MANTTRLRIPVLRSYKLPLFVLLCLCFATAILGDSTAEALLLATFGADMVPKMYLVNSLFLFLFSAFAMTLIDRVDRGLFFLFLVLGHGAILFVVWIAVLAGASVLYVPLFSYAYVSKILLFLMFWTLANDLIDTRRAGAEFPFIAAGGTLGAIGVSFAIPWLLKVISARTLLPVWSLLSFVLALFFLPVWRSFGSHFRSRSDKEKHATRTLKSFLDDLRLMRNEPLLWNMSILYFLLFFILLNQHYGFYAAIKSRYEAAESLASFLGYFTGVSMVVTFLLQISLAGLVLKKIGSTRSMFLLPAVLCLVFGFLTILGVTHPGQAAGTSLLMFWGVVLGVGFRLAFFDSFFSPNFQVFFSSLPQEIRGRGKLSIEGAVKPLAIAFTSFWLIVIAPRFPFSVNMAVLFALSVAMIVQTFRLRSKYTESLTKYLSGFSSRTLSSFMDSMDVSAADNLLAALSGLLEKETQEVKSFVIEILSEMNSTESRAVLSDYLARADSHTRSRIVNALGRLKRQEYKSLFSSLLRDTDNRIVADAVFALAAFEDAEINEGLIPFLRHPHRRVKANAVIALWPTAGDARRRELVEVVNELLASDDYIDRAAGLYALGEIRSGDVAVPMLELFYTKKNGDTLSERHIWNQFLAALAKNACEQTVELLLRLTDTAHAKRRNDVSAAVAQALRNGFPVRAALELIEKSDDVRRHVLVRALYIRASGLSRSQEQALERCAERERAATYADYLALNGLKSVEKAGEVDLLRSAVREHCIEERIETLIYIAAMLDRSGRIRAVVGRLRHENRHVRARALEVLDNAGNTRVNRWVIEFLDSSDSGLHARAAQSALKLRPKKPSAAIAAYTTCAYPWVRTCAAYAQGALKPRGSG